MSGVLKFEIANLSFWSGDAQVLEGAPHRAVPRALEVAQEDVGGADAFADDAFDEYVGGYGATGIGELIFYWPPVEYSYGQRSPVPAEIQARFERIAAARMSPS